MTTALSFSLPGALEASEPPEARGLTRDAVRMLVADRDEARLVHSTFSLLPTFLDEGDLVVLNTSGTLAAAVPGTDPAGADVLVHFSTELGPQMWVVELRRPAGRGNEPWGEEDRPSNVWLAGGATLEVLGPYEDSARLVVALVTTPVPVTRWLAVHGRPIRYGYVPRRWPISTYQNVYVTEPGSAEMPSAGRPFTAEMVTRLVAKGVGVTPVVLHTGVASLEASEHPYPERVKVPAATARRVNLAKAMGGRVVAVGTTVVRALESAHDSSTGDVRALDGWTDLVVTPERGVAVVDGLLTGWHEPAASHLLLLEAVAGRALLERSYEAALCEGYLWHEFGDVHLVLH
ncbi:MAG TPA: S-adenosylmethionine:tRNA ribosyltransferase-isomerase [Acidimicrobiales bacterium]|nr:S-adenosylmethionine:tRNA ribosyltransferase-isomerase [Acidimicrobiales bacterium]